MVVRQPAPPFDLLNGRDAEAPFLLLQPSHIRDPVFGNRLG
jgi:hypothetical protein